MATFVLRSFILSFVFLFVNSQKIDVSEPGTREFYYLLSKKEFITDQIFTISLYTQGVNSSTKISQSQGSQAFRQLIKGQISAISDAQTKVKGTDGERCTRCLDAQIEDIVEAVGRDIVKCLQPLVTATVQLENSLVPIEKKLKENYNTLNISHCNKEADEEAKYDCLLAYLAKMYAFVANKTALVTEKIQLVEVLLLTDVAKCFTNSASTGVKAVNVAIAGLNACSDAAGVPLKLPAFPSSVGKVLSVIEDARHRFTKKGLASLSDKFIKEEEKLKIFLSQAVSIFNDRAEELVLSLFNGTIVSINDLSKVLSNTQYSWCNKNAQSQMKTIVSRVKEDLIRCAEDVINKGKHLQNKLSVTKGIIKQHLTNYGFSSIVLCLINDTDIFVRSDINSCTHDILNDIVEAKKNTLKDLESLEKEIGSLATNIENCQKLVFQAQKRAENVLASLKLCARI